jgi:hypothetical protein
VDVVVHGLGNGDDLDPFVVEAQGVGEGVVASDGDDHVDALGLQDAQHVGGEVERRLPGGGAGQERGHPVGSHLGGVGSRGVEHGAAAAVDGAHRRRVQGQGVGGDALRVVGIGVEQPRPAAADAHHTVPGDCCPEYHRFDTGVESRDVAAPGEYPDLHSGLL